MANWYVVRIKPGSESRAVWHLNNQDFDVYLPCYRKTVRHARKTQEVLRPLFPGYAFINMDLKKQRWRSVNGTVGVLSLVQFGGEPAEVPTSMIDAIRAREDEGGAVSLKPEGLKKGDVVRVREGAFCDFEAIIDEVSDQKRVYLMLDLMGQSVRVSVRAENLAKAS